MVVVGAGAAGLAAAAQLVKMGFKVTQLEARDRVGGRVYSQRISTKHGTCSVELGADVSTGKLGNPLYSLCMQNKIPIHTQNDEYSLYSARGEKFQPQVASDVADQFNQLLDAIPDRREKVLDEDKPDDSLQKTLNFLKKQNLKLPASSKEEKAFKKLFLTALSWQEACLEYTIGAPLKKVSLRCWDREDDFAFSGQNWFPACEMSRVLSYTAKNLHVLKDDEGEAQYKRHLRHTVESISHFPHQRATVRCENGNTFHGDAVLLTVPLGLMKLEYVRNLNWNATNIHASSISFTPSLPLWKTESINNIGNGVVNKLILWFSTNFWDSNPDCLGVCSEDDNKYEFLPASNHSS